MNAANVSASRSAPAVWLMTQADGDRFGGASGGERQGDRPRGAGAGRYSPAANRLDQVFYLHLADVGRIVHQAFRGIG